MKNKLFKMSLTRRQAMAGMAFIAPFAIGVCIFFLYPTISSLLISFGEIDKQTAGYNIKLTGIQNYYNAFQVDTKFVPYLLEIIWDTLINVPLIIIFSLLFAIMLNKVRWLRGFFRVIVILPFLLGTGKVMEHLLTTGVDVSLISITNSQIIPREFLLYLGDDIVNFLDVLFGVIVKVFWSCGVQTLLLLSAVQSISPALYESAQIDGANQYESFWKITLPMVSPVLLLTSVYTIIDSFTGSNNDMLDYINTQSIQNANYGFAAAMGWTYFAFVFLFIGVLWLLIGGYIRRNQIQEKVR